MPGECDCFTPCENRIDHRAGAPIKLTVEILRAARGRSSIEDWSVSLAVNDRGMDLVSNRIRKDRTAIRSANGGAIRATSACDGTWMTRIVRIALVSLLGAYAPGCSLFHHGEPPQQKFLNALNRGNGAEASQVWLTMSAKDRANLSHNVDMKPEVHKGDIERALLKHQREEAAKNGDDTDTEMSDSDEGDINSQQIDLPGLDSDPTAGSLSNLPLYNTMQQTAPVTDIGPR